MGIKRRKIDIYIDFIKTILGFYNDIDWINIKARFIISTGRTGTKFLAKLFNQLSPNIFACHEPTPDFRKLGIDYAIGKISFEKAKKKFKIGRQAILSKLLKDGKYIYIEANCNLFSLIPIIKDIFPDYRIVHIVRDGRDYVRSAMSRSLFRADDKLKRLKASYFPDDPYCKKWDKMTRFEKICWHWVKMDSIIYEATRGDKNCLTLKFEDVFDAQNQYPGMKKLIEFFDLDMDVDFKYILSLMKKKVNKTEKYLIPDWKNWDPEKRKQFLEIAGNHMKIYGYDIGDM